jgi:hypothetical protein
MISAVAPCRLGHDAEVTSGECTEDRGRDRGTRVPLGTAGGDDAEEHARAVRAFGAGGDEHPGAQPGDVLELALGGRIVDWEDGGVDEAEERVAVVLVAVEATRQPS